MNNLLTSALDWFTSMDIAAHLVAGGLHVSKSDITTWGTTDEILADLKKAMDAKGLNGKKLSWIKTEETMGWLKLDSF